MSEPGAEIGTGLVGLADAEPDGSRPVERGPILREFLAILALTVVGLAAVDQIVVQWDSDQEGDGTTRAAIPHEQLGWVNRPHFENPELETVLDRFGLRNPEIPEDAPPDEVRLLGVGASRTYGAGGALQPWCWNYQLEDLFEGRGVRVLNGGVNGYSALQACRRASLLLDAVEPDLVFVTLSPGAQLMLDPSSARNWVRFGDRSDQLVPADVVATWPDALVPTVARVHRWLSATSGIYRRHRAKFKVDGNRGESIQRWVVSRQPRSAEADAMFQATLDEAVALRDLCDARGVELRMLVLPEIYQDSDAAWRKFLRRHQGSGAPPIDTPRDEPTTVLEELLRERGLETWNFFDEVDRMGVDRLRFIMGDNFHWSEPGHEVVALGLAQRLRAERLLNDLRERRAARPRTRPFGENPFQVTGS